ncbi:tRNA (adenosine(37)-N6)-threonylcarbamoyltransferase complex transferase subunit TsaD [Riemerella anatipestifer]|uniref:tRNA (adenosine(37)-N6)-threonylcarbamoyltransferase complex transferase subunit TsaD n=1 Tax=Riemerella anatipestifer TaxID=34085 RepID=UPI0021D5B80E|nr:tRNA (adenosine(37)-N6)-threonylcarbamoyltransferase complex transferase subunit TsaD [Riemerella anatipestifer]MCU7598398.1 tRNA (adenosine(37)-N6)-threonylcarbamoyltransferase complex transferase subunit TsaD [Riemerella anatipestifer]MCW0495072.1 tRNA (adenosine(37)-N6)-threonylcarbamoyltransferase complex transferase subunit TsaD [Riemerella anatipestifer]MCW0502976.1 tRNA (adenosine(37)-N6)-threonylcarbamoyltransferase complex transferase subunit TsaD [Riemerella anatipestifer]
MKQSIILGIESSCDDTSAAIISGRKILSNVAATQAIHNEYGGVVPELASRAHQQNIIPVIEQSIQKANIQQNEICAIGFTRGPGLLGSLLVGTSFAKSLAMSLEAPLIEVNHLQAHILAHFIEDANPNPPKFPFLCLTVSGGHTMIVLVKDYFDMEIIGKTIDDAAGEAFDKIGKIFDLDYPAGPIIDKKSQNGNPNAFTFNKPKLEGYDYSFSGIKTSVLYFIQKELKKNPQFVNENIDDLCASVQKNIIEILMTKLEKAASDLGIKEIAIAGGVSANSALRQAMRENEQKLGWNIYIPKFEYTTDNAAMIAMVAQLKYERGEFANLSTTATARYELNAK